jgi:hypothetical protein
MVDRHLLPLLDGTRDRNALVDALVATFEDEAIPFEHDGELVSGDGLRDALAESVDDAQRRLVEMKLLRISEPGSTPT